VNETGEDGLVITCTPEDLKPLTRGLKDIGVETVFFRWTLTGLAQSGEASQHVVLGSAGRLAFCVSLGGLLLCISSHDGVRGEGQASEELAWDPLEKIEVCPPENNDRRSAVASCAAC
jgi:hypothetical protein